MLKAWFAVIMLVTLSFYAGYQHGKGKLFE